MLSSSPLAIDSSVSMRSARASLQESSSMCSSLHTRARARPSRTTPVKRVFFSSGVMSDSFFFLGVPGAGFTLRILSRYLHVPEASATFSVMEGSCFSIVLRSCVMAWRTRPLAVASAISATICVLWSSPFDSSPFSCARRKTRSKMSLPAPPRMRRFLWIESRL